MNDEFQEAFQRELESLKNINSKCVVKMIDFIEEEDQYYIIQ